MYKHYMESRVTMTPEKSLTFLKEGNQRFINNLKINRDHLEMVNITSDSQFPFASILSCSDSRTSAELIFDQGLGDLFSVRLAGNVASMDAVASLEFSHKILGSKLIVVLGHTNCGAIKGACDQYNQYNLKYLLDQIAPAIEIEAETIEERNSTNTKFVENVAKINIQYQIQELVGKSSFLRTAIESRELGIIGAIYNVSSGKVEYFDMDIYTCDVLDTPLHFAN